MIKSSFFHDRIGLFEVLLLVLIQSIIVSIILNISTDIQAHLGFVRDYIEGENHELPSNFLYYLILYLFSFISPKTIFLLPFSAVILALSIFFKYYICKRFILQSIIKNQTTQSVKIVSLACAMLIFAFSVPIGLMFKPIFYLGYFPPNVWHNSTTIFTMPFALLLFIMAIQHLRNFKWEYLAWMTFLALLNAIAKPSYLFVFIPVFAIFSLYSFGLSKKFWMSLIPILISMILIAIQYYTIYQTDGIHQSDLPQDDGVAIRPFYFYKEKILLTLHPALQFIIFVTGSLIFPFVYIFKNLSVFKKSLWLQFATISSVLGIIIASLIIETGERTTHGNFLWQAIMANFILFFVCLFELIKQLEKNQFNFKKYKLEIICFSIHFVMGIFYFAKMFLSLSYH